MDRSREESLCKNGARCLSNQTAFLTKKCFVFVVFVLSFQRACHELSNGRGSVDGGRHFVELTLQLILLPPMNLVREILKQCLEFKSEPKS